MKIHIAVALLAVLPLARPTGAEPIADHERWRLTFAQDVSEEVGELVTLDEIVGIVERRNPEVRFAFEAWSSAKHAVAQATGLPDPKLSYGYFVDAIETRVGPQRHRFGISQTLPWFGKRGARGDVALNAASVAAGTFVRTVLSVKHRVTVLWLEYIHLGQSLAITRANLDLGSRLESVVLTKYAAGETPHATVMRVQVELGRLEDRVQGLTDRRRALAAELNAELDRPFDAPLRAPDDFPPILLSQNRDQLARQLRANNPELLALRAAVERDQASVDLAEKSAWPDLTVGATYIDTDPARMPGVPGSGTDAILATATINLPLWRGRLRAERASAVSQRAASEQLAHHRTNQLTARLDRALFAYRDADRTFALYTHTLRPTARRALTVTENGFVADEADYLDLVDAQRTLLEFDLARSRAATDRAIAYSEIESLVGHPLGSVSERTAP